MTSKFRKIYYLNTKNIVDSSFFKKYKTNNKAKVFFYWIFIFFCRSHKFSTKKPTQKHTTYHMALHLKKKVEFVLHVTKSRCVPTFSGPINTKEKNPLKLTLYPVLEHVIFHKTPHLCRDRHLLFQKRTAKIFNI